MKVYIITSAKFEECYIEEWVKYHLNIGFDKIIINDNNPKDYTYNPKDILKEYIDKGQVIIERYYDTHKLENCISVYELHKIYTWLYNKYKDEFDWCAKLDIDEYLEIPETNNDIKKFLNQNKFTKCDCILLPWKLYEVKDEYKINYIRLPNNIRFNYSNKYIYKHKNNFKYIFKNTNNIKSLSTHTPCFFDNKAIYVDSLGNNCEYLFDDTNKEINNINNNEFNNYLNELYKCGLINHYRYKSVEETINQFTKMELHIYNDKYKFDNGKLNRYNRFNIQHNELYNKYSYMFDYPRDLYKIYFLQNDNT